MSAIDDQIVVSSNPARPSAYRGPDYLLLSEQPQFRRFWYVAAFTSSVADRPIERTVLGTSLVLWRADPDASISVALDRCAHRDAPLSKKWIEKCHLVCPYHGWEWDKDGTTQRIPQFPIAPHPSKSGLTMIASQERHGMVWVCLATEDEGGPLVDIPPVPEFDLAEWRVVPEREWLFDCTAKHLRENNFDAGHVAFVHANSFGNRDKPELNATNVVRTPYGLETTGGVPVDARPGEGGATVRKSRARLFMPFLGHIGITYPDSVGHIMIKAITPIDDEHHRLTQTVLGTDTETQRSAADILAFDERVENEDRELRESLPKDYPLAPHLNAHAKADRASLTIRRVWSDLIVGKFLPDFTTEDVAS